MKTTKTLKRGTGLNLARMSSIVILALAGICLRQPPAEAKANVNIDCSNCGAASAGGSIPFSLWYTNGTPNPSWQNYITVDVYDKSGDEVYTSPVDGQIITGVTATGDPCPGSAPYSDGTGASQSDDTVVVEVSGEWDGNSCSQVIGERQMILCRSWCRCGRRCIPCDRYYSVPAPCCQKTAAARLWTVTPKPTQNQANPKQYQIDLAVDNSKSTNELDVHFVVAIIKGSNSDTAPVKIVQVTDSQGGKHNRRRVINSTDPNHKSKYKIDPKKTKTVTDLQIDLGEPDIASQIASTDYVYADIVCINTAQNQTLPLCRIQLQPAPVGCVPQ